MTELFNKNKSYWHRDMEKKSGTRTGERCRFRLGNVGGNEPQTAACQDEVEPEEATHNVGVSW